MTANEMEKMISIQLISIQIKVICAAIIFEKSAVVLFLSAAFIWRQFPFKYT